MYRQVAAVMVLGIVGFAAKPVRADEKKPAPLPHEKIVEWDVSAFEESSTFKSIKRDIKNGQVVWVLENRKMLGNEYLFGYRAEFLDEDGVKLWAVEIRWEQFPVNWQEGERNRLILELPKAEKWKTVRRVVIKGM
jgi:hypothetical protein